MERILITGITGMAGSHLVDYLLSGAGAAPGGGLCSEAARPGAAPTIYGTKRGNTHLDNLAHCLDRVHLIDCDLLEKESCDELISIVQPDAVFHLAARTFIPASWEDPKSTIIDNVSMQINLFESIRHAGIDPAIVIALSSDEYGRVNEEELPIKETTPFRPISPYGVSKVSQDMLGYQYFKSYGMQILRMRPFNHEGPRRGDSFVTSNFAKQIAEIELGIKPPILYVGDLSAQRDWTDVRDVVRAYWLAVQHCIAGEDYNVSSGTARTVRSMLDVLLSLTATKIEVAHDEKRLRKNDMPILVGDPAKFCKATGWKPEFSFEQTMLDLLNYWRQRVRESSQVCR